MFHSPLRLADYRRVVVLTGAGVSAPSGLPTFRGPSGGLAEKLWPVSDGRRLHEFLPQFWQIYGELRAGTLEAQPNAAHFALAQWQKRAAESGSSVLLWTQNVDGLHQIAGSSHVGELHGSLRRSQCTNETCPRATPFDDERVPDIEREGVPHCPICGAPERIAITLFNEALPLDVLHEAKRALPERIAITLFNEALPLDVLHEAKRALRDCDLFLAIGTSGLVSPASDFVRSAHYVGARTVLLNLTPLEAPSPYFSDEILGRAEEILPLWVEEMSHS